MRFDSTTTGEDLAFKPNIKSEDLDATVLRNTSKKHRRLQKVLIKGIVSRPELNACIGRVIGSFDSEKQLWPVRVVLEKGDID